MHISEILQQNEGINDPYIFKAIFMAGGAGSGKSFVVRNVLGQFQGLKVLNNDKFLKYLMDKEGLSLKMPSKEKGIYSFFEQLQVYFFHDKLIYKSYCRNEGLLYNPGIWPHLPLF